MSLDGELKYRPEGYQHTWAFKNKKSDGYKHLFDLMDKKFRTGLVSRVRRFFDKNNVDYEVIDDRKDSEKIFDLQHADLGGITPFPFQVTATASSLENNGGILASPTGTGKTIIMGLITKEHYTRTLILVNSRILLDQTYEAFDQMFPGHVGIIGSGDFELNNIVIATMQSISKILGIGKRQKPTNNKDKLKDWINNVGLMLLDESHDADNKSIDGIYSLLKCKKIFGTTATPYKWAFSGEKSTNLAIEQYFGPKIYDSRDTVDFIKIGLIVPLYINKFAVPTIPDFNGRIKGTKEDNYKEIIDKQVVENNARTELVTQKAREMVKAGKSCYIYFRYLEHSKKLQEALSDLNSQLMYGKTSRKKRKEILEQINKKEILLVISDIGSYGLNIPSLDSLVLAQPVLDARQLYGRVCRAYPGKEMGLIFDPVDLVPILAKHSNLRTQQARTCRHIVIGY